MFAESLIFLFLLKCSTQTAPPNISFSYDYKHSLNPNESYYPRTDPRPGAFWKLSSLGEIFPALDMTANGHQKPPTAKPYFNSSPNAVLVDLPGVDSISGVEFYDGNDKSIRTNGKDKSCLIISGFTAAEDKCLKNPSLCSLADEIHIQNTNTNRQVTGLSMSLWVNLPQSFITEHRHILDTGGTTDGSPGISIEVRASDGRKYIQQIDFIVSTGPRFWKVTMKGMIPPYKWTNIGFRWSSEIAEDGAEYGLQVFVNGRSTAWKRGHSDSTGTQSTQTFLPGDVKVTLGCHLDGTNAQEGMYDNLAFWYWRLRDLSSDMKPINETDLYEINYFMGGRNFSDAEQEKRNNFWMNEPENCRNLTNITSDDWKEAPLLYCRPEKWHPWLYIMEKEELHLEPVDHFLLVEVHDVSPATAHECNSNSPNSKDWGEGLDETSEHPIDCADTPTELRHALAFHREGHDYKGYELVRAMVRTLNKNPQISERDLEFMFQNALQKLETKVMQETGHVWKEMDYKYNKVYAALVFVLSRLSEHNIYGQKWSGVVEKNRITFWMHRLDNLLLAVANNMPINDAILVEANETAATLLHVKASDVRSHVHFPDYTAEMHSCHSSNDYLQYLTLTCLTPASQMINFPKHRQDTWGSVQDYITLPKGFFSLLHTESIRSYDRTADVSVVAKIYNKIHNSLWVQLYEKVDVESVKWRINSRVLSISVYAEVAWNQTTELLQYDYTHLKKYPVEFYVKHLHRQDERPVKKGAILCVYWRYNTETDKLDRTGYWDTLGCQLIQTNDTHSKCRCNHLTDFAILMEEREPAGTVKDDGYIVCYVLYGVSLLALILFMVVILANTRLHYELHIVNLNIAACMLFALIFYLITLSAHKSRMSCIIVSVFMHYCYTAAYAWCVLLAHYIFRAITSSKMGQILPKYCVIGYGLPGVLVVIMAIIDVTKYGIGERCLGAQDGYFLWVYIGTFIVFCALVCPLFAIAIFNLHKNRVRDPEDLQDIKWCLLGIVCFWPFIMLVWLMAMFVYLIPQDTMIYDFLFELFNSFQGIVIFLLLGIMIPSFRNAFCCCYKTQRRQTDAYGEDWTNRRRKIYVEYFG